jgi:hypothetical protein
MKRLSSLCSSTVVCLLASLALTGCSGNFVTPDVPVEAPQTTLGTIQGSVFGGHAPLVGSHVYVIQAGTSGYGSSATPLLNATYKGSYPTAQNSGGSDGNVPNSWYYVTTDSQGAFNITGDYACAQGLPVFLYAFGGTPTLAQTSSPSSPAKTVFTVTSLKLAGNGQNNGTATFTWTTSTPSLLYTGEQITPSGFRNSLFNGNFAYLTGTQIVTSTPSATTFTTTTAANNNASATYTNLGTAAKITAGPQPNTAVVNMATLGVCPSSGDFSTGASALSYVYMNEVSTVATAYAFQGFTAQANNAAFDIGTSSNVGQPLLGIQNAALTAANLYDIQGGNQSTTYQGEGHIARAVTAARNGIVPEATLDMLGNILAACVDSGTNNAHEASPQCTLLFANATSDGTTGGNAAIDTATAAINIARYPAGTANSSFVSTLYHLPSAVVPFTPTLTTQPNDFTVAIEYPLNGTAADGTSVSNNFVGRNESIAIDSKGNVWSSSQGNGSGPAIFELSPTGALSCSYFNPTGQNYGYLAIDINDKPWSGNANTTTGITQFSPATTGTTCNTTLYNNGTYHQAYTVVDDGSGNTFFMAQPSTATGAFNLYKFPAGSTTTTVATNLGSPFGTGNTIAHASLDNSTGNIWITNENGATSTYGRVNPSTGAALFTLSSNANGQPEVPAIDAGNRAWIPLQAATGSILRSNSTGSQVVRFTNNNTGAEFASSFGAAVDGNANIWITNRGQNAPFYNAGAPGSNSIVELSGATGQAISPSTNYTLGGLLDDPLNLAIDPSGNMWITNYGGDRLFELIGTAAPVATPISVASTNGKLGTKP